MDDRQVSPRSLIVDPPRRPPAAEDFYQDEWNNIPSSVRAAMDELKARTSAVFHDSSYYFATCHGIEHQLVELSHTVRVINLCPSTPNSHDLELTDYEVGTGLVSLLDNQATDYPHSEISFSMIRWSDLGNPDEHKRPYNHDVWKLCQMFQALATGAKVLLLQRTRVHKIRHAIFC